MVEYDHHINLKFKSCPYCYVCIDDKTKSCFGVDYVVFGEIVLNGGVSDFDSWVVV